ncbi:hypothetical protein DRQ33_07660 [bacterium]|nr:MAG: hypothetical protein DRQ33_07660 [bacterium]
MSVWVRADDSISVCLFWRRPIDKIIVQSLGDRLYINDSPSIIDSFLFEYGEKFDILCNSEFYISDGNTERMLIGRVFGCVGKQIFAKIHLDDWLLLTLLGEFPSNTPQSALDAGAVILRSFALSYKHHKNCDVCDRTHCALLCKPQSIPRKYRKAVENTKNLVLTYNDVIIPATITANCGGNTLPAEKVWGVSAQWSVGVPDSFCSPLHWQYNVESSRLDTLFDIPFSRWKFQNDTSVYVGKYITTFELWDTLVNIFDWGTIKSPTFTFQVVGDSIAISGDGFGHRVGLCQDGATVMANRGYTMEEILLYYFPLAKITYLKK